MPLGSSISDKTSYFIKSYAHILFGSHACLCENHVAKVILFTWECPVDSFVAVLNIFPSLPGREQRAEEEENGDHTFTAELNLLISD